VFHRLTSQTEKGICIADRGRSSDLTLGRIFCPSISKFSDRQTDPVILRSVRCLATLRRAGLWSFHQRNYHSWIHTGPRLRHFLWPLVHIALLTPAI
jgi:hypothetical protein